jgi:hypothetical protein
MNSHQTAVPSATKEHDFDAVPQSGIDFMMGQPDGTMNEIISTLKLLMAKFMTIPANFDNIVNHAVTTTAPYIEAGCKMNVTLDKVTEILTTSASSHLTEIGTGLFGDGFLDKAGKALLMMAFLSSVIYYCAAPTNVSFGIMIVLFIAVLYVERSYIISFMKFCGSFIPFLGSRDAVPQIDFGVSEMAEAISMLLFALNVKNYNLKALPMNIIAHLKSLKSIKDSVKDIISFMVKLLEMVLDYGNLGSVPKWAKFLNVEDPDVRDLFTKCDEIRRKNQDNALDVNKSNANLVQDVYIRITNMLRTLPPNAHTAAIIAGLKTEQHFISKVLEVFRAAKLTDDGKRVEPTFAVFAGAPGNFKSQMIDFLCCELQKRTLSEEKYKEATEDHFRYVFKREQANVYWDGYRDPHIVIFDDLGQFKTCVQNIDNEFSSIMSAVNELPLMMHMAAVDAKGNTYFKSRFILATTNFVSPQIENINSLEAYQRRIAAAFYMVPRREFCTKETLGCAPMDRKLDKANPNLVRGSNGQIKTHPDYHSEFIRYDPKSPANILGVFTFQQVVNLLVEDYKLKDSYFSQKMEELEDAYNGIYLDDVPTPAPREKEPDYHQETALEGKLRLRKEALDRAATRRKRDEKRVFTNESVHISAHTVIKGKQKKFVVNSYRFPNNGEGCSARPQMGAPASSRPESNPAPPAGPVITGVIPSNMLIMLELHVNVMRMPDFVPQLPPPVIHNFALFTGEDGHTVRISDSEYSYLLMMGVLAEVDDEEDEDAVPQMNSERTQQSAEESIYEEAPPGMPTMSEIEALEDEEFDFDDLCTKIAEINPLENAILLDTWMIPLVKAYRKEPEKFATKMHVIRTLLAQFANYFVTDDDVSIFVRILFATGKELYPKFSSRVNDGDFTTFLIRNTNFLAQIRDTPLRIRVNEPTFACMKKTWSESFTEYKNTLYTSAYPAFKQAAVLLKQYAPVIALAVGLFTTVLVGVKLFGGKSEEEELPVDETDIFNPQSKDEHHLDPRGKRVARKGRMRNVEGQEPRETEAHPTPNGRPQMGVDEDRASFELSQRICNTSLVQIEYCWETQTERMGHGLIISDRMMLVPRHYYTIGKVRALKPAYKDASIRLTFRSTSPDHLIESFITTDEFYDEKNWVETPNLTKLDQALYVLPPDSARTYRNILKNIADLHYHRNNVADMGFLMGFEDHRDMHSVFRIIRKANQGVMHTDTGRYVISSSYIYHSSTDYGDCGTPLYVIDKSSSSAKIIGMHVAGTTSSPRMGISTVLVREFLEEALLGVPQMYQIDTVDNNFEKLEEMELYNNKFRNAFHDVYRQNDSPRSKIVRSPLYEAWGPAISKPAFLRVAIVNGEKIDVKANAYSKVAVGRWKLPHKLIQQIGTSYLQDLLVHKVKDCPKRLYTFEEAICGLSEDIDYGSVARNTSPGYPYIFEPAVKRCGGKRYWFGKDDVYAMDNDRVARLKKKCEVIIRLAAVGRRSEHVFIDFLKDERRPIAKADAGKTRMVNAGPMDYLIITRMYFGAFANWFTKNRCFNGSAIGVNPYSKEWHVIADLLEQFGRDLRNVGAGDYSSYDGSEKPVVHDTILQIINKWYDDGEENALIRTVLWAELVQARHLSGDIQYTAVMSLPSGHPLTALVNTMYNAIAFRYCWYRANKNDLSSLKSFTNFVYTIMLGDDNVYSVHPDYTDIFNDVNLEGWMLEFGLIYTNETKTSSMSDLRHLTEVSFLKRTFRFEETQSCYVAPLDLGVILEMPYWTKSKQAISITESNVETSIMELALHTQAIYDEWAPKIVKACEENDIVVRADNYFVQMAATTKAEWYL